MGKTRGCRGIARSERGFRSWQARRLEDQLNVLGVESDIKTYPAAGHSYMSEHTGLMAKLSSWGPMKVGFNTEAAEDSWRRVDAFFAKHLAP